MTSITPGAPGTPCGPICHCGSRGAQRMIRQPSPHDTRLRLDALLTELVLYAKELCPNAQVEASALQYEDEDGRVEVFPPCGLPEAEEERIELALCARSSSASGSPQGGNTSTRPS